MNHHEISNPALNELFIYCISSQPQEDARMMMIPRFLADWMIRARESIETVRTAWRGYRHLENRSNKKNILLSGVGTLADFTIGQSDLYCYAALIAAVVERLQAIHGAYSEFQDAKQKLARTYSRENLLSLIPSDDRVHNYNDSLISPSIAGMSSERLRYLYLRIQCFVLNPFLLLKSAFFLVMTIFDLTEIIWRRVQFDEQAQSDLNVNFFVNLDRICRKLDLNALDTYYADNKKLFKGVIGNLTGLSNSKSVDIKYAEFHELASKMTKFSKTTTRITQGSTTTFRNMKGTLNLNTQVLDDETGEQIRSTPSLKRVDSTLLDEDSNCEGNPSDEDSNCEGNPSDEDSNCEGNPSDEGSNCEESPLERSSKSSSSRPFFAFTW